MMPPKLDTQSKRKFRTRLQSAANQPPNFAQHYTVTIWGCGSNCFAGALVDLQTGDVFPIPFASPNGTPRMEWMVCGRADEKSDVEFRIDSRLMVVRCGHDLSPGPMKQKVPDVRYWVWEENRFRQLQP